METPQERILRERVLTASPAQRVVMLYDRLALDLARALADVPADPGVNAVAGTAGVHLRHAVEIVAELSDSVNMSAGEVAVNLQQVYGWMLSELCSVQLPGQNQVSGRVNHVLLQVQTLRSAWATVAEETAGASAPAAAAPLEAGEPALSGAGWSA